MVLPPTQLVGASNRIHFFLKLNGPMTLRVLPHLRCQIIIGKKMRDNSAVSIPFRFVIQTATVLKICIFKESEIKVLETPNLMFFKRS